MKLIEIAIHNFRSIIDAEIEAHYYMLLVGANNAGKSNLLGALRAFYDDAKWTAEDFPKVGACDSESWVQLKFVLDEDEWDGLADDYKTGTTDRALVVRRYFKSDDKTRVQKDQSNIYGFINGQLSKELFYGAKNVGTAKVGQVLYVPALSTPNEQTKMSGPSPLRNMLNFLMKKVVSGSDAYKRITKAFEELNAEATQKDGFLAEISSPLNDAILNWGISINLSVNAIAPEDITKSLIQFAFVDSSMGSIAFDLERYGHGFQRSVIYELIRLAPTFKESKKSDKKEFNPTFNLVLFEEPEAFLRPNQQESMAYHLRRLGAEAGQQVIVTTHSPTFAGKAAEQIGQVARVVRTLGITRICQPKRAKLADLFTSGGALVTALTAFVANTAIDENRKARARKMIANPPSAEIATQEERFRFQLWLDAERSKLFFANKILFVEGPTERALFNYLLANQWSDLSAHTICVVDVLGKYNFHRLIALASAFGIPHGIMLDDDANGQEAEFHNAVNDLVCASATVHTLSSPFMFPSCIESFLGLPVPERGDRKPVEMLKAITSGKVSDEKLKLLRSSFCAALDIKPAG